MPADLPERLRAHADCNEQGVDPYQWPSRTVDILREAATALEAQAAEINRLTLLIHATPHGKLCASRRVREFRCDCWKRQVAAPREENQA